ncbi:natural product biosynthesis luciferase-like monooxygenase protein/amino acid adenylation domain-containing protein [Azospirillum fermentarium]|uniref:non-ribosomal peptide synthetase/type I polyketide synthase n=1 Tax=Azospirillum fermentarium TaxID=1233114 RepID=UPI00222682B1|nr:MupA/Atu3671 family FMN-dependent luciferase-like monooxygenase [Azospirillum fermentarium]MCW2248523.1 natural product biosynthesis luciferase-like monooxygenase protein/amino acid adenylation domain-containing protein [Azospirillum fermentarium]
MTTPPPDEMTPLQKAVVAIRQLREKVSHLEQAAAEPIAVVGIGCRMPGAHGADAFWEILRDGQDMVTEIPADRWDTAAHYDPTPGTPGKTYARHGGFLRDVDRFDATFFGISAREAEGMDPQQRVLLEVAWEALEDAGLIPEQLAGSATGVFVGVTASDYGLLQVEHADDDYNNPYFNTGTPLNGCAGRLSYVLGFQGPCLAVDTACSSSLSAIHLACASLRAGECAQALAGGVNLILSPKLYVTLAAAGMLAPDGRCKTFDAAADGYVRGEGCGLVVLKRYRDAVAAGDRILALIRASAVNQDGASSGFTVPNGIAQQRLIRQVLGKAGLSPADIDYVEAHGTGTSLGDVIEVQALGTVLGQAAGRDRPLLLGSVKSNIGHLESAAGVAGLIKLIQALRHDTLPPTLHVTQPNPNLAWETLNVAPVRAATPWPRGDRPRRAGLSSFGATGSNAHLIVEEAPAAAPPAAPAAQRPVHILALSAKTPAALTALAESYETLSRSPAAPALADACHGAATARSPFPRRAALCAGDWEQARGQLAALREGRAAPGLVVGREPVSAPFRPVFLFSGQGALQAGAGRGLFDTHPTFREALERCADAVAPLLDRPLLAALYPETPDDERLLERAIYAQPALFSLQYALAALWRSWGVEPAAVLGHSLGEYCAACVAGAVSLEDGLRLVTERARLMDTLPAAGAMAAVFADAPRVEAALTGHTDALSIAVINGPGNTVISGDAAALADVLALLTAEGISSTPLAVTHAFHSPVMDPILGDFERFAATVAHQPATLPMALNLTGGFVPAGGAVLDAAYWRRHCREPVLFGDGLGALLGQGYRHFIEIGAGTVLTQLGRRREPSAVWLPSLAPPRDDWPVLGASVAEAYVRGAAIDWAAFDAPFAPTRAPVPTYPFQRKSHWFATTGSTMDNNQAAAVPTQDSRKIQHDAVLAKLLTIIAAMMRVEPGDIDIHASFLEMGADSLVLVEAMRLIDDNFGVKLQMRQFFEDVTSIAALADHLVDRSTFGLTPPPAAQPIAQPAPQTVAPQPVAAPAPAPAPVPVAAAPVQAAPVAVVSAPVAPAPVAVRPVVGGTALEQLLLAQTQVLSQQLALLQGAALAAPAVAAQPSGETALQAQPTAVLPALQPPRSVPPPTPAAQPAAAAQAPPKAEDRSSPLRALANPVSLEPTGKNPRQDQHLASLIERYLSRTPRSKELAQACRAGLADSRASVGFRFSTKEILYPITGAEALGSHLRDIDGNDYIDLTMGFGVLLFGNRPGFMKGVIEAEVGRGFQLGPRSDLLKEVTDLFLEMTGHERVAFTNSGTEAVMTALRLARAATGRSKIAMFDGSYHGHSDGTLARTIQANGEFRSEPLAPGVPAGVASDVLVLEYGTDESLEILRRHAHELAAVLVEPVQSRRPDFRPVEFLHTLRALTEESGTALVFDEMITGFRAHQGGAQALFGVRADIATYGKIIGGGMPIGAVAGTRRFLDGIDGGYWAYGDASYPAAPRTYFGGTFCQHPFTMAAALAALRHLKAEGPALQERLNQRTTDLANTLNAYFEGEGLPLRVTHFASMFRLVFQGNLDILYYHLLLRGVYIWEWRNCFLSTAHTDDDLAHFVKAIKDSVDDLRQGGFLPERRGGTTPAQPTAAAPAPAAACSKAASPARATSPAIARTAPLDSGKPEGFWARHRSKLGHNDTVAGDARHHPVRQGARTVDFGLFFFGPYSAAFSDGKYDLIMEGAHFADREGFSAIWLPERHFHEFGGFSPNPSVVAAALARETHKVQLRSGAVVAPLHDPIRVAEEWSVVDNLSRGRVGVGFASGWHANDFVFSPETYEDRREVTFERIETVRRLWRGEKINRRGGQNSAVELAIYPRPKQAELPTWLAIVNNPDTYRRAGAAGIGVLTNLMGQSLEDLAENIAIYRQARADNGLDPAAGNVSVLIHTYLDADADRAIATARQPLCDYLLSGIGLFQRMAQIDRNAVDINRLTADDKNFLVNKAYDTYVGSSALIGSPETCAPIVERLNDIGVDEISCFVDFGVDPAAVLAGLPSLNALRRRFQPDTAAETAPVVVTTAGGTLSAEPPEPMGEAQKQLWVLAQLSADGSRAYNDPAALLLEGDLDAAALDRAIARVVARHEALRTTFDEAGEHQIIHPAALTGLTTVDLSGEDDPQARLTERLAAHTRDRFDFVNGPLFVPYLYRLAADRHVLFLQAHHIGSDGPAMGIVLNEALACYEAERAGTEPALPTPLPYRDFVRWQREQENSDAMARHEAYWLERFATPVPPLDLPSDRPRPAVKTYDGARLWTELPGSLIDGVKTLGRAHGSTVYMVLLAAYSALLHRLGEQDRIVVGCPYAGRSGLTGGEALVGYCVHLLPVLSTVTADTPFGAHLKTIRSTLLDAFDHQDYPFARLIDKLGHKRDSSRAPLLGVVFNLERDGGRQAIAGLEVDSYRLPVGFTGVDLTLTVYLRDDGASIACDYNTGLFDAATVEGLLDQYRTLLESVTADPGQPVAAVPLLSGPALERVLVEWNAAPAAAPAARFTDLWADAVARHPHRVALIEEGAEGADGDVCLTYAELDRRANRLAHRLQRLGVGPDRRVGVCLERSWPLLVAMLATLKAGGAFVPLDPAYPAARLALMMQDAQIAVLLTREGLAGTLPDAPGPVCRVDADWPDIAGEPATAPVTATLPGHLAYVIYTSGSTGKPKGVMISHHGMVNYLQWAVGDYAGGEGDGAPVLGSIGFDATLTSLFVPLLAGASVVMLAGASELEALTSLRRSARRFNFVKVTPAHLELLNTMFDGAPPAGLARHLVLGGEALTATAINPWLADGTVRAVNEYGPTETVVGCCVQGATAPVAAGVMPIGRPIAGTRLHVLDRHLQPVPPGMAGELYIGGAGLARGYLGRGDLTAGAFVPDPFTRQGERLYRTGDRARYLPDGTLTYLGRMDRQIKLHGFRIELGEIEGVLGGLPEVGEAVVLLREDQPGHPYLAAYVRPAQPAEDDSALADALRRALKDRLPAHMVPAALVVVAQMPLTGNGKIDRARLPVPEQTRGGTADTYLPARTDVEQELAGIWQEVLGIERVGVHDNFFDLGGDSFLLLQVCSRLDHLMDRDAVVIAFFKHPTVASLAQYLSDAQGQGEGAAPDYGRIKTRADQQRTAARQSAARRRRQHA